MLSSQKTGDFGAGIANYSTVRSKRDISPSEGHYGVKTIMDAILKGRSKPKCSKLATSKGPS